MRVDGDNLYVKTGRLDGEANFDLKLYVQRRRLLKSDIVLINRVLTAKEFSYEDIDERTGNVRINLDKILGEFESDKKHVIELKLDVKIDAGTLLNGGALPSLHQESTITIH